MVEALCHRSSRTMKHESITSNWRQKTVIGMSSFNFSWKKKLKATPWAGKSWPLFLECRRVDFDRHYAVWSKPLTQMCTFKLFKTFQKLFRRVWPHKNVAEILLQHGNTATLKSENTGSNQRTWEDSSKADSHIACRAHAIPLPCCAAEGLECVFPVWFTQCGRVRFTLAMPCACPALTMPFFSRPWHSTAVERQPVSYLPAFGFFQIPRGLSRRTQYRQSRAGARHGMCELMARHGRGTVWARHAMCESASTLSTIEPRSWYLRLPSFWSPRRCHLWENFWEWWWDYWRSEEVAASTEVKLVEDGDRWPFFLLTQGCWSDV